ncbi:radical SAM superfamily protein [Ruminiclostridium hungatei]|uniref:Radical SAM superfamily protein n=1 Tax=Ruminiclostridium hungatei TaxID=48256 RepID=A0A1V4SSE0_RUMHU|nr:radical SAM protein [Ruminiclostridium hungatei]OPX46365.1 radical SAM superfamily protein [Ruminiclostridium hungatei]
MRVLLIDVDGKLPNLALMKLSTWHKSLGDEVFLNECINPDKVYISVLFTWNRSKVEKIMLLYPNAEIEVGGTGWDIHKTLPAEIEAYKPDYNLYKVSDILPRIKGGIATKESKIKKAETIVNAGMGFTSRGCIRNCGFCFVPPKEGKFHRVGEIQDLINPKSNVIILLDNNLTADPDCIEKLHEIRDRGLVVDITQGIDVRLVTPGIAHALSEVKHLRSIHYAWDLMPFERQVFEGIKILSEHVKLYKHICMMLTGYDTTFEEDMYRFRKLIEQGVKPYVMPYNKAYPTVKHQCFAGWVNSRKHTVCSFEEFEPWVKSQNKNQLNLFEGAWADG